jgi:hypothetical protein
VGTFLNELEGDYIDNTICFRLEKLFAYISSDQALITVPEGFITNFASIPKALRWYIDTTDPIIRSASVIHDFLYVNKIGTRAWADRILREAMLASGATQIKAQLAYLGVRIGGSTHWGEPIKLTSS